MVVKYIVISGGAYNGLAALGATYHLQGRMFDIDDIVGIYGSSVGALIGTLLALRCDRTVLFDYIIKRPWHKTVDLTPNSLIQGVAAKGLFTIKFISSILVPLLETADLSADITLGAFFEATNIDLHLFTTRLNGISITNLSHTTFPDLSLLKAVHMSCTIPFLFQPLYIDGSYHVDGGVACHFPLSQCLDAGASEGEILAVSIRVTGDQRTSLNEDTHILEYGLFLFQSLVDARNAVNNVTIPNMLIVPSSGLDLDTGYKILSRPEERQKLIDAGEEYARLFLLYKEETQGLKSGGDEF